MDYMPNMLGTVRKELNKHKGHWPEIARRAKVSYSFVAHIAAGFTEDPRVSRLQRLLNVLKQISDGKIVLPNK